MARTEQSFHITPTIGMHVYYDRASKSWVGFYFSRETDESTGINRAYRQVGDAWYAHNRDEILIHRPEVNSWHYAVVTA